MTHLKRAALAYLSAEGEVDIKHVRSPNRTPAGALGDSDQAEHGPSALEAPQIPLPARKSLTAAIPEYLEDCLDRQGKSGYGLASRTHETYKYRLGFLTAFRRKAFLDEVDDQFLKAFRRFLRDHPENLSDRTSYNTMQAVSTFCSANGMPAHGDVNEQGRGKHLKIYPPEIADWMRRCGEADTCVQQRMPARESSTTEKLVEFRRCRRTHPTRSASAMRNAG